MLFRDICKVFSFYLLGLTMALLIPTALAGYYEFIADAEVHPQPHTTIDFFSTVLVSLGLAMICRYIGRKSSGHLFRREGLIAVVLIWFVTPFIAGMPFYQSGTLKDPFHAYFEAASGFTTTGATTLQAKKYDPKSGVEVPIHRVFCGVHTTIYSFWGTVEPVRDPETGKILYEGIEAVGKALLFWRSFMQWLGGMGIVVLFVAILPALGVGGKVLFQAEVPGPIKDSLTPRIKETAINLWKIYVGLSIAEFVLLMFTNPDLDWLEATTITFSTMSTGGFTIKNGSVGTFNNVYTDWIIIAFMVLASVNFSLYFYSLRGKFYRFFDSEFILFVLIIIFGGGLVSWFLVGTDNILITGTHLGDFDYSDSLRYGVFQFVSVLTTTGFSNADYDMWPYSVQVVMLIAMFVGGMSGSTAGGMKVIRQLMIFRITQYRVESIFRPETVRRFRVGDREVDQGASNMVLVYFVLVISITAFATVLFVFDGIDPETSLALSTLLVNNIGIGFRMASSTESLAFLSDYAMVFSSLLMIFGRLEFFAVLAVMVPAFWQTNR